MIYFCKDGYERVCGMWYEIFDYEDMIVVDFDSYDLTVDVCLRKRDDIYSIKGLNDRRDKEGKIGYYVWNKSDLERYKEDYCVDEEIKEHFQKWVIDHFIDGQCCATFSW